MSRPRTFLVAALAVVLAVPLAVVGVLAAPAQAQGPGFLTLTKTVTTTPPVGGFRPGDTFDYQLQIGCSNLSGAGCDDTALTDSLPAPLVLDTTSGPAVTVTLDGNHYQVATSGGNAFTVTFTEALETGVVGLSAGASAVVIVHARVPADASADDAGSLVNTAQVTQTNGDPATASAPVELQVPTTLAATVSKSATPTTVIPAVPGRAATFTIGGANTSNAAVDSLTLQDPSDSAATDPYQYLELTGLGAFSPPAGADTVQVDWRDADGTWHAGSPTPVPDDASSLLDGLTLADVHGLRFVFSTDGGRLPITPAGGAASIAIETQTRANVTGLPANTTVTVTDVASSQVSRAGDVSTVPTASATVSIRREPPTVTTTKSYDRSTLVSGAQTTATIRSVVGATPVTSMTIDDPADGQPDLAAQGLTFDGFAADGIEWPVGATGATITYDYADGPGTAQAAGGRDTLPDPETGRRVVGFHVTFTGTMDANEYASLPFTVTADPITTDADVTATNSTTTEVTSTVGETGQDTDTATLTLQPLRITTSVGKTVTPAEIWGLPGAQALLALPAALTAASTTGSQYLQISDPADPGATPSAFWDHMDFTGIAPTDIPQGSTLTLSYWDGSAWTPFPGATDVPAQAGWTYAPPADLIAQVQGVRFTFSPTTGLLPPGFNVLPYVRTAHREVLRSDPGTSALPEAATTYPNDVRSEVHNPVAVDPTVTDDATTPLAVRPLPPEGPGDTVDKTWLDPTSGSPSDAVNVTALSDQQRTARLLWGTHGVPTDSVQLTDPATSTTSGDVAGSVFDAFDLVRIAPITTTSDPLIRFDAVSRVERWSASADDWVDITAEACIPTAACDGGFPGYTLTAAERADTLGVRLTLVESPTRASRITAPTDPAVGSGVAASTGNTRPVDLVFQIRQQLRSDPTQAVLGEERGQTYNTGVAGQVENSVRMTGTTAAGSYDSTDTARITIIDTPVNVSLTKTFDQTNLGLPPATTAASDYPLVDARLHAVNTTQTKIRTLTLTDPAPAPAPISNTFDLLNLYKIQSVTVPAGATSTTVHLTRGASETDYTVAQALALTSVQLADVTGISVTHTGLVTPGATADVLLTFQLRGTHRDGGAPLTDADEVTNVARSDATNPEGTASATSTGTVGIVAPTYGVATSKTITPASRYEDQPNSYQVALRAQPTGTVRTRTLTLTDDTATFWNAFDFTGFASRTAVVPISQLRTDALVGVTYEQQGDDLVTLCDGSTDLDPCWQVGQWRLTGAVILPVLPDGVAPADVQGLRFSVQNANGTNWERPSNPALNVVFTTTQRTTLRYGPGGSTTTPVPSTRPGLPTAPGETVQGQTTDTVQAHGDGAWTDAGGTLWSADASATSTTLLRHRPNELRVVKTPGNGDGDAPSFLPDSPINYQFAITNTGTWPQTGTTIVDRIDTNALGSLLVEPRDENGDPAPGYSFQLTGADGTQKSTAGFAATLNETTGVLTVIPPSGFVLQPGDLLLVTAPLIFQAGLFPATLVHNAVTVSNDRILDSCTSTANRTIESTTTDADDCTATTVVDPLPASPLRVVKSVKGVGAGIPGVSPDDPNYDDLGVLQTGSSNADECQSPNAPNGFYRSPCTPITRPGGTEEWQIRLTNAGNIPAGVVAGIDVLPATGDRGVIIDADRGSHWTTTLLGDFANNGAIVDPLPKHVTIYYMNSTPSVACNAADILSATTPGGLPPSDPCAAEVAARPWIPVSNSTPVADLAQARALKTVIDYTNAETGDGLAPGQTLTVSFDTRTAWYPDVAEPQDRDSIAWNSVAAGARGTQQDVNFVTPVVEPQRVGVAMATGKVELRKQVVTPPATTFPLPTTFPVRLACESGGQPVPLVDLAGVDRSVVSLPADGSVVTVNDGSTPAVTPWSNISLPWGAQCTASEVGPVQGATVTYDPPGAPGQSAPIEALRDYSTRPDVAHPAFVDPITLNRITTTNTYQLAGFTVSKVVDASGAQDQDGNPITYPTSYGFTASCLFNGQEVVPSADRSFSLAADETRTVTGLPAGATCTVIETGPGGAARTSHVVTAGGVPSPPVSGTRSTFVLTPDAGTAPTNGTVYVNTYTVGAARITKAVTGDGAEVWGTGPFTVHLRCTLDGASPNPVYDADHDLGVAQGLVWDVTGLPTGAACTVTEPGTGGANATSITGGTFTVGDDPADPSLTTVTNTFTTGSVAVRKEIAGLTGDQLDNAMHDTYTFELTCTRRVDGELAPVEVPGGPLRSVVPATDPVATWDGLPTDAACTVVELFTPGTEPDYAEIDPARVFVGVGASNPPTAVAINGFATAPLHLTKVVDGDAADHAPATFTAAVSCTWHGYPLLPGFNGSRELGLEQVTLRPGVTVTSGPLPLGSVCVITETGTGQATATTITGDGTVTIAPGDDAAGTDATITNTFSTTGFTVSKAVDVGGARTQDGLPVAYDAIYAFTASCLFGGTEQLADADRAFTLAAGESHDVTGVPVNSACTVTETGTSGAPSTTVRVTQDGTSSMPVQGATADLELGEGGPGANVAAFTNHYTAGSVTVTKRVAGAGARAWGSGPYEVRLVCTLEDAVPGTVYDATHELTPDDLVWTVDDVATGAHCDATELRTGGATTSVVTPAGGVTVPADGKNVGVAVTNTFDVGSVRVHKSLTGPGAGAARTTTFGVSLTCTRTVDGTAVTVEVPGGADRDLDRAHGFTATYAGLPAGASCHVAETSAGGAEATTISPADLTVGAGTTVDVTVTNRFAEPPASPSSSAPTATPPVRTSPPGWLAVTGAAVAPAGALVAAVAVLVGLVLLLVRRRLRGDG